jgi:tetratricopeptide (TPR) repeat protein
MIDTKVDSSRVRHSEGVQLYSEGGFAGAAKFLHEALRDSPSSELANDWGAAELACGRLAIAEQGFAEALSLDIGNVQAAAKLGALLASLGRAQEAIPLLENATRRAGSEQRADLEQLLANCRTRAAAGALNQAMAACQKFVAEMRSRRPPRASPAGKNIRLSSPPSCVRRRTPVRPHHPDGRV